MIAGVVYTRKTLLQMESLSAEAESARLKGYLLVMESDREGKIEYMTDLMRARIKDNDEGRPSVTAPDWCRLP